VLGGFCRLADVYLDLLILETNFTRSFLCIPIIISRKMVDLFFVNENKMRRGLSAQCSLTELQPKFPGDYEIETTIFLTKDGVDLNPNLPICE
jgi:hypothetical protein